MLDVLLPPRPLNIACHLTLDIVLMIAVIDVLLNKCDGVWTIILPRPLPPRLIVVVVLGVARIWLVVLMGG